VPTAIVRFPNDLATPPREMAERFFDVRRFTVMERSGHFSALEVPDLVAREIRAFVAELRAEAIAR
jgi:epoxide hydrolase